jgi:hypothetical protein
VARTLRVNVHYTGLQRSVRIRDARNSSRRLSIESDGSVQIPVTVAAEGMSWYSME